MESHEEYGISLHLAEAAEAELEDFDQYDDGTYEERETMTAAQISEAIGQMKSMCETRMASYKAGMAEYPMAPARGLLIELGYDEADTDAVIESIAAGGFTYCLDWQIQNPGGEYPSPDVCHWGLDQLLSRLECLRSPVSR